MSPRSRLLLLVLAALTALGAAAPAHATTVNVQTGPRVLEIHAGDGELNNLKITYGGASGTYTVSESGTLVALHRGTNCANTGAGLARCTGIGSIVVEAGDGADTVWVDPAVTVPVSITDGAGDDTVTGGGGSDTLVGSPGNDTLDGGPGNDTFGDAGGLGADALEGGAGTDTASYSGRLAGVAVTLDGAAGDGAPGEGDDVRPGIEQVWGGSGPDVLVGAGGDEHLDGNGGDDVLDGRGGADKLQGDGGRDAVDYRSRTVKVTVTADGIPGDGAGENDTVYGDVESIYGGTGNDDLTGNGGAGLLDGGAGNDTIRGGGGDDDVAGGPGDDVLHGGDGADALRGGDGRDTIDGGNHDDTIDGGLAPDVLGGGGGSDAVDYSWAQGDLNVDLAAGRVPDGDSISGIDGVYGGAGDDVLRGNDDAGRFDGGPGDDVLDGRGGADRLAGGPGRDRADYGARRGNVNVSPNDSADDGESGERDDVRRDVEVVSTGSGSDRFTGEARADVFYGGAGNDTFNGGGGDDLAETGDGNDTLSLGDGNDVGRGGNGNDRIAGENGADVVEGGAGDDNLSGDEGADRVDGADGNDTVNGGGGDDALDGGAHNDTVSGGAGHDTGRGGAGTDRLTGGDGNDRLEGADGNDTIDGDRGGDHLLGGAGDDRLGGGDDGDLLDGGEGSDRADGGNGDDTVAGAGGNDTLYGSGGRDTVEGGGGNDGAWGGADTDAVRGDDGDDKVYGDDGADEVDGGAGTDTAEGGRGDDGVTGGDGDDRVNGGDGNDRVDGASGADRLSGGSGADALNGGGENDELDGDGGEDRLDGAEGDDDLSGGGDADVLVGGAGADQLRGDGGEDTVDYAARVAPVRVTNDGKADDGEPGEGDNVDGSVDHAIGGAGNDLLRFRSDWPHRLYGEGGNDTLDGGPKPDQLAGGPGNDQLIGRDGVDQFDGGAGNDKLSGADGAAETLRCGAGKDSANRDRSDKALSCETTRIGSARTPSAPAPQDAAPVATSPGRMTGVKRVYKGGRFVSIPGSPGERIDRRLLKDLAYLKSKYRVRITDGYALTGHAPGGEHPRGLAVDLVPGAGGSWSDIDRLARWAEPRQGRPRRPFRWVGYNGDSGHGRGHHLHLSWRNSGGRRGKASRWVEVLSFKAGRPTVKVTDLTPLSKRNNARIGGAPAVKTGLRALGRCKGPAQLLGTFKAAGRAFKLDWKVLAAISEAESGHGCDMGPTATGALGWTHFATATWKRWGMDADGDGKASPFSSADAIFSTARVLRAAGAPKDYRRALTAYRGSAAWAADIVKRARKY